MPDWGVAFAVLTRDVADAQAYASALAPLEIVAMPVTRTVGGLNPYGLARELERGIDLVVVASPRAAHELVVAGPGPLPPLWAVGPATKRALDIARIPSQIAPGVTDGAGLARALVKLGVAGKRVLVPRAEEARTEPIEILRAAGAEVIDVVAYRTICVMPDDPGIVRGKQLLESGQAAVCGLFAPSQVQALHQHMIGLRQLQTHFCAIGETTAAELRAKGVAHVAVAPTPTPEGMAQAVRSVYPIGR